MGASDPVAHLGLALTAILVAAKLGGDLAMRFRQPAVLGELVAGALLGNLHTSFFDGLKSEPTIDMLARLGALLLLFEVGLESTVREVLGVGVPAVRVALLGTVTTFALGWGAAAIVLPGRGATLHAFLGSAIIASSVGISARVLKDLGKTQTREAHTILAAAVVDDVFGLVILALVSAIITHATAGGPIGLAVLVVASETAAFLAVSILLGVRFSPHLFALALRLRTRGALLAAGLALCFLFAWGAGALGLAPIIGAFAAGLVLDESHSAAFVARGEKSLAESVEPITSVLVPVFFLLMGMRTDLSAFAERGTLLLTAALLVAAAVGKLACAAGVPAGVRRWGVAMGMMPRGEVCLVFASLGAGLHVDGMPLLDKAQYSALVCVVILTTIAAPAGLKRAFANAQTN